MRPCLTFVVLPARYKLYCRNAYREVHTMPFNFFLLSSRKCTLGSGQSTTFCPFTNVAILSLVGPGIAYTKGHNWLVDSSLGNFVRFQISSRRRSFRQCLLPWQPIPWPIGLIESVHLYGGVCSEKILAISSKLQCDNNQLIQYNYWRTCNLNMAPELKWSVHLTAKVNPVQNA